MPTSEQSHELKAGAPTGNPQQYEAYQIQDFFQATDPSGVGAAGQQHQTNGGYALLIANDLNSQGKSLFDKWQGPAAQIAQTALAQLQNTAQRFGEASNQFGTALSDYGGKLGTYKSISWPVLNQDTPPKPGQLTALNRVAQQAMAQANGDMQAAWSAMPSTIVSELPGISNPQSATSSTASGPGSSYYSPQPGSRNGGSAPTGTVQQAAYVPPGTAHQPGSTVALPPGSPSHLSSVPPGLQPGPGAPPPGNPTLPPGVSPPPGSAPPGPIGPGPGPILSSTPPPSPEGPKSAMPPGEEPLPNMVRPFAPGTEPVGSMPPGRLGPNTSVEAAAPVAQDFAGPGTGAMAAQDESLGLSAAEMGQRDMLGMPMAPMGPMGGGAPGSDGQGRSLSVTEGREVWSDDVELNSSVIGDAPNYLGLTGRRPVRPEPGARLSTEELERLLHDAVKDPGDQSGRRGASIPGEISSLLDGVNVGMPLPDGTIRSR